MTKSLKGCLKVLIPLVFALVIGAIFILSIGENPVSAYGALLKGAFGTKLGVGNVLAGFTPLMLTGIAFALAAQAGAFNAGVEGEVILGGITAAYIGINWGFLPVWALYVACFLGAMAVAALWALIPAFLKVYYNVSEVCVTILMNTVALYIGSYLVSGPMSAGAATPQTDPVLVTIPQILKPSSANAGIFIALIVIVLVILMLYKTKWGYKIRAVGTNPANADYAGIDSKRVIIGAMVLSGMLGGIAGCIEVLGVHGYYLDGFAKDLGTNGMLAALIVKSNMVLTPFIAFFISVLKAGAMAMQQATSVPKSIVDTVTAVFIIFATMDFLIERQKKKKAGEQAVAAMEEAAAPNTGMETAGSGAEETAAEKEKAEPGAGSPENAEDKKGGEES